jgi:hypothetical protein
MHKFTWNIVVLNGVVIKSIIVVAADSKEEAADLVRMEVAATFGDCDYMMNCIAIA